MVLFEMLLFFMVDCGFDKKIVKKKYLNIFIFLMILIDKL